MKYLKRFEDVTNDSELGVDASEFHDTEKKKKFDFDEGYGKELSKKEMKKLLDAQKVKDKNVKKVKESVVNATPEEALAYYKRIKRTHFGQKADVSEDAPMAHSTTKFYNDLTRKWEDISAAEVSDRIKSLEEEIESK